MQTMDGEPLFNILSFDETVIKENCSQTEVDQFFETNGRSFYLLEEVKR